MNEKWLTVCSRECHRSSTTRVCSLACCTSCACNHLEREGGEEGCCGSLQQITCTVERTEETVGEEDEEEDRERMKKGSGT